MNARSWRRTDWLLLLGFCAYFFYFGLASFGLVGADEPRYAQVAREMLSRHDWITPTLGGLPWLEKPPLYYWQAMLAYRVFGVSDWAARLPSAVDATLLVFAVYLFLRRFRSGYELDGALITASAAAVIGFARAAAVDMPLASTFTIAMLGWFAWQEEGENRYLAVFYVFCGLGMLAKGPVAPLLAGVVIVLFAIARREYLLVWRTLWLPGVAIFCAVALPWYIAAQVRNPDFFHVFIVEHNLARFGTDRYHHTQPFWYYGPVILLGLVPWTVLVASSLMVAFREWWREKKEMLPSVDDFSLFLMIWLLVPVLFFSVSQSKLPGYILPAIPAGTLLLAEYVRKMAARGDRLSLGWIVAHSLVAASVIVPAVLIQYILLQRGIPWSMPTIVSCTLAVILAVGMSITLWRFGLRMLRFITLVPVVVAVAAVLRLGAPVVDVKLSSRPLAIQLASLETKSMPTAVWRVPREVEYGLAFYRNQTIRRYELGQVPDGEHLVIAPQGSQKGVARKAGGRRVSYLGSFAAQGLDYYWVAGKGMPAAGAPDHP